MSRERRRARRKRQSNDEEMSGVEEEEDERALFFIPSLGIDIDVLSFYLVKFCGHDSDAEPGRHPKVRSTFANNYDLLTANRIETWMVISLDLNLA